jgi:hypothetical protein
MAGTEKRFWFFLIILNFIQFLPAYFANTDTSTFLPVYTFTHGYWFEIVKSFFKRNNYDIFRISIDLTTWVLVFYFLSDKLNVVKFSLAAAVYFMLLLIFQVYYHLMYKIFLVEPVLFNDISLLKLGYHNVGNYSLLIILGILLTTSILFFFIYILFSKLFSQLQNIVFGKASKVIIGTIGLLMVFNLIRYGVTTNKNNQFQFGIFKFFENIQNSFEAAQSLSRIDVLTLNKKFKAYNNYNLSSKPDIYLIFVESYGKIVYQDSSLKRTYSVINQKCQKKLTENGWYVVSDFSLSPVSGGSSWVSFSSVMFGYNFKNHSTYSYFLRNNEFRRCNNIFKYFQTQGYKSFWINPLPENVNVKIPWKLYSEFYGVNKWINYPKLDYHGKLYGFGPAPPDQYSLFKAKQIIDNDVNQPHIVFYITHNSHSPFFCPDSVSGNWKTLSTEQVDKTPPSIFIRQPKAEDYIKSIKYDLEVLTDFIVQSNNKHAIYLLIGDHQPPVISNKQNGFETPVHIITSDSVLLNNFYQYGFTEGLYVRNTAKSVRHEAIYSMLLHEILHKYGKSTTQLPPYSPNGIEPYK